jgi:hypothetical protein
MQGNPGQLLNPFNNLYSRARAHCAGTNQETRMGELLPGWAIDIIKLLGSAGLIFIIWWKSAQWNNKVMTNFLEEQARMQKDLVTQQANEREAFWSQLREERKGYTDLAGCLQMVTAQLALLTQETKALIKSVDEMKLKFLDRQSR